MPVALAYHQVRDIRSRSVNASDCDGVGHLLRGKATRALLAMGGNERTTARAK